MVLRKIMIILINKYFLISEGRQKIEECNTKIEEKRLKSQTIQLYHIQFSNIILKTNLIYKL